MRRRNDALALLIGLSLTLVIFGVIALDVVAMMLDAITIEHATLIGAVCQFVLLGEVLVALVRLAWGDFQEHRAADPRLK